MLQILVRTLALAAILCPFEAPVGAYGRDVLPAFPGAEGAGAQTPGGRGGKVFLVTTLQDYKPGKEPVIPGSLRAAVEAKGPRFVVFRVSGTIELKADIRITEPFITIAGQTAPGDGVCLRNYALVIRGHDVIVRYLRIRPGDRMKKEMDAVSVSAENVILDHLSASWAIDETLSVTNSSNVTVQWCFITESLNNSYHKKGPHGYGSLINGWNINYHHNLYAFHRSRNPRPADGDLDFRNNVIYGWLDRAGYSGDNILDMNYVGNYLKPGPFSKERERRFAFLPGSRAAHIYLEGNVMEGRDDADKRQSSLVKPPKDTELNEMERLMIMKAPFDIAASRTESASEAYERVLRLGGCSLPTRDAVDQRVVNGVKTGAGRIVDKPEDVGGHPELRSVAALADMDSDGMPDDWEKVYGLNPADPGDAAKDRDGDGYTNIEEYVNGLVKPM